MIGFSEIPGDISLVLMRCFLPFRRILYFSSTGHPGMGGLDIFRAITDSLTGRWRIENMQSPVNSQGDDFGMTFEPGAPNRGFFSSNRGNLSGWDHIYSFEFPEVHHVLKGLVYDKEGDALSDALVTLVGDDGTYLKINVKKDGTFTQEPHRDAVMPCWLPAVVI